MVTQKWLADLQVGGGLELLLVFVAVVDRRRRRVTCEIREDPTAAAAAFWVYLCLLRNEKGGV